MPELGDTMYPREEMRDLQDFLGTIPVWGQGAGSGLQERAGTRVRQLWSLGQWPGSQGWRVAPLPGSSSFAPASTAPLVSPVLFFSVSGETSACPAPSLVRAEPGCPSLGFPSDSACFPLSSPLRLSIFPPAGTCLQSLLPGCLSVPGPPRFPFSASIALGCVASGLGAGVWGRGGLQVWPGPLGLLRHGRGVPSPDSLMRGTSLSSHGLCAALDRRWEGALGRWGALGESRGS